MVRTAGFHPANRSSILRSATKQKTPNLRCLLFVISNMGRYNYSMNIDFKELFEYFDQQFGGIKERMGGLESDFKSLQSSVDNYALKINKF